MKGGETPGETPGAPSGGVVVGERRVGSALRKSDEPGRLKAKRAPMPSAGLAGASAEGIAKPHGV